MTTQRERFHWLNERVRILRGAIRPIECVLLASLSLSLSLQWDRAFKAFFSLVRGTSMGKCKFVLEPCRGHHSNSQGTTASALGSAWGLLVSWVFNSILETTVWKKKLKMNKFKHVTHLTSVDPFRISLKSCCLFLRDHLQYADKTSLCLGKLCL